MSTRDDTQEFISVLEGRIHFVKRGSGFPLLLLHSMGQSTWGFETVIEPLAREFTCYALDMLGHGESGNLPEDLSWLDIPRSVAHFMEALNIQRAHIIGVSVGAAQGVELAASYPERVDRLVLAGCPVTGPSTAQQRTDAMGANYDDQGISKRFTLEEHRDRGAFANPRPEWVKKVNELYAKAGRSMYRISAALYWYDIVSRFHHLKPSSTLVLYGEHDPQRQGEHILVHNIPGASVVIIPGLAHHPPTEDPEAFLNEVLPFLKGDSK